MSRVRVRLSPTSGVFTSATAVNDAGVYAVPTLTHPAAGAYFTEPTFGTSLMRLTDASNSDGSHNPYSYWGPWSKDSTLYYAQVYGLGAIGAGPVKTLYDFNPVTGVPSNARAMQASGTDLSQEGLIWSRVTNALMWGWSPGSNDLKLYSLTPGGASAAVVDLATRVRAVIPTADHFFQMSMGGADRYFCWTVKNSSSADVGVAVYDRTGDILSVHDFTGLTPANYDEAHLTRDGLLTVISFNPGPAVLWDHIAHPVSSYSVKSFTDVIAHVDFGPSTQMVSINIPAVSGNYAVWDLASFNAGTKTADQASTLIANIKHATATIDWPELHLSWQNLTDANAQRAFLSTEMNTDQTAAWRPFFEEIWVVNTDGTGYRRLAHNRSQRWAATNNYSSQPKGACDPSGRWYAWTANWNNAVTMGNGTARIDVHILKVPTEAEFAAGGYLA